MAQSKPQFTVAIIIFLKKMFDTIMYGSKKSFQFNNIYHCVP